MQTQNEALGSVKDFLAEELDRRVRLNPRYSLRAFSRDIGLSPGELSEILNGKRRATAKAIIKVSKKLGLSLAETQRLLGSTAIQEMAIRSQIDSAAPPEQELSLDLFRIVSDWYCFAILNLAETRDFRFDPQWIASRLEIGTTEAKLAIDRLERVGLIHRINGQLQVDPSFVMSPSGIPSDAIRSYHRQILEKAIRALETQPVEERDITGVTLALDPRDIPNVKQDILKFQNQLAERYSKGRKTEVYQIESAFFRLTKKGNA